MLKNLGKYIFMVELGYKYIKIFKKTFLHPFITQKYAYEQLSLDRQEYAKKVLKFLNIQLDVVGETPKQNGVLYVINHRSLLDIIVMENIFAQDKKNGTWIAKQELFDNIIYGEFFKSSGCISVNLKTKKGLISFFKTIKNVFKKVDTMNLYMFPEGERYKNKGVTNFQSGAAKIAKSNNLKVIPVYIEGEMEKIFEKAPFKETKKVRVFIGDFISHEKLEEEYLEFFNAVTSVNKGDS